MRQEINHINAQLFAVESQLQMLSRQPKAGFVVQINRGEISYYRCGSKFPVALYQGSRLQQSDAELTCNILQILEPEGVRVMTFAEAVIDEISHLNFERTKLLNALVIANEQGSQAHPCHPCS